MIQGLSGPDPSTRTPPPSSTEKLVRWASGHLEKQAEELAQKIEQLRLAIEPILVARPSLVAATSPKEEGVGSELGMSLQRVASVIDAALVNIDTMTEQVDL